MKKTDQKHFLHLKIVVMVVKKEVFSENKFLLANIKNLIYTRKHSATVLLAVVLKIFK